MMRAGSKPITPPGIGSLAAVSRHARFAERIAGRYAPRSLQRQARLSMTFARRWTLQTFMQRHWHRSVLMVAPRIEIRLQATRRVIASGGPSGETPLAVSSPRRLNPVRLMAETLIEYVKARSRRIEPTPIERHVPRVVRRMAPVSFSPEAVDARPVQPSMHPANRHGTSPVTAAPALDMDRLTEQVIQGIDRRIIAQRERLGRF